MRTGLKVISYTLAALAGVCFIRGLAILSKGRRMVERGKNQAVRSNACPYVRCQKETASDSWDIAKCFHIFRWFGVNGHDDKNRGE